MTLELNNKMSPLTRGKEKGSKKAENIYSTPHPIKRNVSDHPTLWLVVNQRNCMYVLIYKKI